MILLFALFWSAIVGFMDLQLGGMILRQAGSRTYLSTQGTILSSEAVYGRTRKGRRTVGLEVRYTYTVSGREYTGDRYAFNSAKSSDSGWVYDALKLYPPGAKATVYYDPSAPNRAVLRRGLDGSDLFILLFMTPFNAIALGLLGAAAGLIHDASGGRPPLKVRPGRNLTEHVDAGDLGPFAVFLLALGLGSFFGVFIVALSGGFHPSLRKATIVWALILGLAAVASIRTMLGRLRGNHEIIIDRQNGVLSLPPMHGRKGRSSVPISSIVAIQAEYVPRATRTSKPRGTYEVQALTLHGERLTLIKPSSIVSAERMAEALRQRLGL